MPTGIDSSLVTNKTPGGVHAIIDRSRTTGDFWFVHSGTGASTNSGRAAQFPFATMAQAITAATANQGDEIIVMPGHAESYTATDGFDVTKAGLRIIGLGVGANRPTFTFADTDAQVNIGASSTYIENLRFVAGISAVVAGVQVETNVTDVTFKDCEWFWGGTTTWDFVISLQLEAGNDRVTVDNCRFLAEPATAGAADAISFATSDNLVVKNCEFMGDYSTACVLNASASAGFMFLDNLVYNADADEPYLSVHASTTGVIANTRGHAGAATVAANAVAAAMAHCENFVVRVTGTIAIVRGVGGSPILDADN